MPIEQLTYASAYATNAIGTSYGDTLSGTVFLCLGEDTVVTTSYGTKLIQDIDYDDELLVWNFDEGCYTYAKPVWIMQPFTNQQYCQAKFDNGSEIITIADGKGHSIFNFDKGIFDHVMKQDIGTTTIEESGKKVKLLEKNLVKGEMRFYNVITHTHMNLFSNGILTSTKLNNIYPIENMKFLKTAKIKQKIKGVPKELHKGLRLSEQSDNVEAKIKRIMAQKLG